jgi:hypothetical protein
MHTTLTFFSLISELISEANCGLQQAIETSKDQPVIFVAPQVDISLQFTVVENEGIEIIPSNAFESNYYSDSGESQLKLTFKLKP